MGLVAGIGLAVLESRVLRALLYSISATDPLTFATVPLVLLMVASLACLAPARRATRVDPLVALRND
jgi:ABC-type lipoprotein release transport system permease subunit